MAEWRGRTSVPRARRQPGRVGGATVRRSDHAVPHHRRPHRQPEPAGEAPARHRASGRASSAVEVYGGALLNSWLDRDLGLSGRVALRRRRRSPSSCCVDRPAVAAHPPAGHPPRPGHQQQGPGAQPAAAPRARVGHRRARAEGVPALPRRASSASTADDVVAWDVMIHDVDAAARVIGRRRGARLLRPGSTTSCSCWARSSAARRRPTRRRARSAVVVPVRPRGDRQHVGHRRRRAARCSTDARADRARAAAATATTWLRALAASMLRRRPTWPTPPTRTTPSATSPDHRIALNGGPVVKINANQRYATDAAHRSRVHRGVRARRRARAALRVTATTCRAARPSARSPRPASASPPSTSASPQLSMHSARELMAADDARRSTASRALRLPRPLSTATSGHIPSAIASDEMWPPAIPPPPVLLGASVVVRSQPMVPEANGQNGLRGR